MRDWHKELPPGTLLCRKNDHVFALVISVRTQSYSGPWTQLYLLVLTCMNELLDIDIESGEFYRQWFRVLT